MPLTQLDPNPALVVIDLQKFVLGFPAAAGIVPNTVTLVRAFRERQYPVILVKVTLAYPGGRVDAPSNIKLPPGSDLTDLIPQLEQQPEDTVIAKPRWDAFIGTSLDFHLRQHNVMQIFLTGVSTSIGVESTARSAWNRGYNLVLVSDAMADRDPEEHRHSIEKIFPRVGEVATTAEVLARLQPLSTP